MADQLEPFVGPRPFEREDEKYFFGRDQAASELVSLILSYPSVILYAQSGAGKTSLLKAKVLSVLEDKKGFDVPPIARVRGQGTDVSDTEIANVYVANALRDLSDNSLSPERRARLTFAQYLAERPRPPRPPSELDEEEEDQEGNVRRAANRPRVLIFDQFEELFTLYPERYNDRKNFFEQLREALEQDSLLRVVFSMREDYIAELDPYVHILPDSLRTRFRLERLRKQPAVQAVLGPFTRFNEQVPPDKRIQISKEVAGALVDNLRTIKVHSGAGEVEFEGEFVEPVHLQIVCKALLEKMLVEGKADITDHELKEFGNVTQALADYFERAIEKASQQGGVDEGKLRRWFNDVLVTRENTRSTVLRGKMQTAGISNDAIDVLAAERLIRSETRDNREWYELSHDKLIEPIRLSFHQWLLRQGGDEQTRLNLIARAENWLASHRTDNSLLLTAAEIATAKRWTNHEADGYSESLAALVDASQAALDRVERERERAHAKKLRRLAAGLAVMVVVSIGMAAVSAGSAAVAVRQSRAADRARADAEVKHRLAETARLYAEEQKEQARLQSVEAEHQRQYAEDQKRIANEQAAAAKKAERLAAAAAVAEKKASAEAKRQKILALSSTFAARSELMIAQQPSQLDNSVKHALASLALDQNSVEGAQALRHGMELLPVLSTQIHFPAHKVAFLPNGDISAFVPGYAGIYDEAARKMNSLTTHAEQEGGYDINSDDGRYVATISRGEAKITNVADANEKSEVISFKNADGLWYATLSPDGKYFAGFESKQLRVWEVKTKRLAMDVPLAPVNPDEFRSDLTFSQNGVFIAVKGRENSFVFKVEGGEKVFTVTEPESGRATYALGENYLALGANEPEKGATVSVWDLRTNTRVSQWLTSSLIENPVFGPHDTKIATTIGNQVTVWDTKSGREIRRVSQSLEVKGVFFSPDGDSLATTGEDRTTRLWDLQTGHELFRMGHNNMVTSVNFSRDGKYLVTASDQVRVWDISSTGIGLNLSQNQLVDQVVVSNTGAYLAVLTAQSFFPTAFDNRSKTITVFDTQTGRELFQLKNRAVLSLAFSANDEFFFVAGTGTIEAYRTDDGNVAKGHPYGGVANDVEISGNGRYAVVAISHNPLKVIDLSGQEPARELSFTDRGGTRLAISSDGQKVFFQDSSGTYFGWDKNSGLVFSIGKGNRLGTATPKTSPDGRYFVFQPAVGIWRVYDLVESKLILNDQTENKMRAISFSRDGRSAAFTLRNDNKVYVYDLLNQQRTTEFISESSMTSISFSDDLKYVAAGGGGLVQVWSLATKNEVARIEYGGSLRALSFSPDGRYVVTGSLDRSVRLRLLRTSDLINIACKRTGGLTEAEWPNYFPGEPYQYNFPCQK